MGELSILLENVGYKDGIDWGEMRGTTIACIHNIHQRGLLPSVHRSEMIGRESKPWEFNIHGSANATMTSTNVSTNHSKKLSMQPGNISDFFHRHAFQSFSNPGKVSKEEQSWLVGKVTEIQVYA